MVKGRDKHINSEIKKQNQGNQKSKLAKLFSLAAKALFFILLISAAVFPFTQTGKKILRKVGTFIGGDSQIIIKKEIVTEEKIVEVPVEVKIPSLGGNDSGERIEPREPVEVKQTIENFMDLASSSQINFKSKIDITTLGNSIASEERANEDSYTLSFSLKLNAPKAASTLEELSKSSPALLTIFPGLEGLMKEAKVSPYYSIIYKNKTDRIRQNAMELNKLLSRHNFFDLQTILNLETESGRKVMIMQSDMDVVSDGSDGDRLPTMPDKIVNSSYYQPSTSYFWQKQTETPNPMIAGFENRILLAKAERANQETSHARKEWLRKRIKTLETKVEDMKWHSYLIAEHDPFIVIPINMLTDMGDPHAPKVGDYALVVYKEKVYPCIVGDGGPTFKVGEASLRLAKELNKRASSYSRPVSDLSVTYIVFPYSREKEKTAPNYEKWKSRCQELIEEIGGISPDYPLHNWENTLPESK